MAFEAKLKLFTFPSEPENLPNLKVMNKHLLAQDAAEMMRILTTAKCVSRYSTISPDRLAEILTAAVTEGDLVGGNSAGYDVNSRRLGFVEVKARILGTDGPLPRVSLKTRNIEKSDFFMAVRWTRQMELYAAVGLPKASAAMLHAIKRQATGLAHIGWQDWVSAPGAVDFRDAMLKILAAAE
jgi:hypothetical protein